MSNTIISQNVINYNDSNSVERFKTAMDTVKKTHGKFNITDMFPLLKPFDPHNLRHQMKMAHHLFDDVVEVVLRERLKHRELKMQRYGDMLDSLLDYSQENKDKFSLIHVKSLIVVHPVMFFFSFFDIYLFIHTTKSNISKLKDSFLAGADTSPRTTTWAMTEMWSNPDVYARVRKEVSEVVREDGKVHEAKILDLPYLLAVIKESMRLHPPIPLLPPHNRDEHGTRSVPVPKVPVRKNGEKAEKWYQYRYRIHRFGTGTGTYRCFTRKYRYRYRKTKKMETSTGTEKRRKWEPVPVPNIPGTKCSSLPQKTMKEVKLGDFIIPTNTQILLNAWAIARDPSYWENPSVFMPERFLGNKVDYKGQHFQFIPFG
ncbi:putative 3,9-dihydroxypterocarpan 6A-monooxygenase [Helianthus anomalus]